MRAIKEGFLLGIGIYLAVQFMGLMFGISLFLIGMIINTFGRFGSLI